MGAFGQKELRELLYILVVLLTNLLGASDKCLMQDKKQADESQKALEKAMDALEKAYAGALEKEPTRVPSAKAIDAMIDTAALKTSPQTSFSGGEQKDRQADYPNPFAQQREDTKTARMEEVRYCVP